MAFNLAEFRERLTKAAAYYGIPEASLPRFVGVIEKLHTAADWEKSGKTFDAWIEGLLEAEKELVAMAKAPYTPGYEHRPGMGNTDGKTYQEIMALANADPTAFKEWYKTYSMELKFKKEQQFKG